jgi:hypothetical protein
MTLTKIQTALFGVAMLAASPILVPVLALIVAAVYLVFALLCVATVANVSFGE